MLACVVGWVLRPAASLAAHQKRLMFAQDARALTAAGISSDGTIGRYGWVVCPSAATLTTLEVKTKGVDLLEIGFQGRGIFYGILSIRRCDAS